MKLYFVDDVNGSDTIVGTLEIVNGKAVGTGIGPRVAASLTVVEPNTLVELKPSDGDRYLDALRYEFRGILRAIREEDLGA